MIESQPNGWLSLFYKGLDYINKSSTMQHEMNLFTHFFDQIDQ